MYEIAVVDICGGQDKDTFSDFLYGLKNAKKKNDLAASFLKVILSGISSFFLSVSATAMRRHFCLIRLITLHNIFYYQRILYKKQQI